MAKQDSQGKPIILGDRLHLYDKENDWGTGTVVPGPGRALMVMMDPGSKLEGKHNLRDISNKLINYIIIGRREPKQESKEEKVFTQEDLDNWNYLVSRGFTGSLKRTTKAYQITLTITEL